MHAQKDLNLVVLNAETREIGQNFVPPKGSPSRSTTLHNGDDELKIEMGDQNITVALGSQTVSIMMNQTTSVNMAISSSAMLAQTHAVGPLTSIGHDTGLDHRHGRRSSR